MATTSFERVPQSAGYVTSRPFGKVSAAANAWAQS